MAGVGVLQPRSRICVNAVQKKMSFALGRLYVEKNFDEDSKQSVI